MNALMNLYNSFSEAVNALPQEDKIALYAELKAAQEKMDADKSGCYQPLTSVNKSTPPGAKQDLIMSCTGCEARREWIRKQKDAARQSLQQLIKRLNSTDDKDNRAK